MTGKMELSQAFIVVDRNDLTERLIANYTAAIADYLEQSQGNTLPSACELGYLAVEAGLTVVEMANIHQQVLEEMLQKAKTVEVCLEIVKRSGEWFAQILLAFDRQESQLRTQWDRRSWEPWVNRESIPDLLYAVDLAGHLIRWNQQLEMVTGWEAAELKNKLVTELFVPEVQPLMDECIQKALVNGKAEVEAQLLTIAGPVPYQWKAMVLKDPNGQVVGLAGVGRNTVEGQISAALQESELRFHNVMENINEFFWLTNADRSKTIYVSPAYEQIWGRSCQSLYEQPSSFLEAVHPEDREGLINDLPMLLQGSDRREYRIVKPDGTVRWISDRTFPVRNRMGEVYRIACIAEDITERQQQAKALEQSVCLLRSTLEATADGILAIDKDGEIVEFNYNFVQMWDLPEWIQASKKHELVVTFVLDRVEDPEGFLAGIRKDYKHPEIARCQTVKLKDGRIIERYSLPNKIREKILGRIVIFRDITQRQRAEERQAELNTELEEQVEKRTAELRQINDRLRVEISDRQRAQAALETAKEQLQAVLDAVPGLVSWIGWDLRYIGVNQDLATTFKCPPETFVGQPIGFLGVDTELSSFLEAFFATEENKATWEMTVAFEGEELSYLMIAQKYNRGQAAVAVGIEITERQQTEAQLRATTSRLTALIETLEVGVLVKDESKQIVITNQGFCNIFGIRVPPAALMGADFSEFATDYQDLFANGEEFWQRHHQILAQRKVVMSEEFQLADGRTLEQDYAPIFIQERYAGHLWMYRDVSARKQADRQVKASLEEKETLLKEIHHRVKNNLQIIISLMRLQSRKIKDREIIRLFEDSENRVRSMAKVHEQLYQANSLAKIDFQAYITELVTQLYHFYNGKQRRISFSVSAQEISLDINTAIPCGLIINELVSNAFKYAFEDCQGGNIWISLTESESGQFILIVSDNGVGLPNNFDGDNWDSDRTKSLGLQLVYRLTKQLEGNIELERSQGTKFRLVFARSAQTEG